MELIPITNVIKAIADDFKEPRVVTG